MKEKRKYKFWTEKELSFLLTNQKTMTVTEIARSLKKAQSSVFSKIKGLKGPAKRGYSPLNKSEAQFIKNNIKKMSIRKISQELDRPYSLIFGKIKELNHGTTKTKS